MNPIHFSKHSITPVSILCVIGFAFLARWNVAEVWTQKITSSSGTAVTGPAAEQPEIQQAVEALKTRIQTDAVSSAVEIVPIDQQEPVNISVGRHHGFWSILPAIVTLGFCVVYREPLPALVLGIVTGAIILGRFDITDDVFVPGLASLRSAQIVLLYLWLLGGLLGVWSRSGAAFQFARWTCQHFVTGPRSAKLVAWFLGVLFFQGGTISTVLVGTTVKPITDQHRISSEELSYIVDSTASPIASLIAFNAWPGYVQALIFVPGVAYLASEELREAFFFDCTMLSFYSIFAILGTFLLSIDRAPILGRRFRAAIKRSRSGDGTGSSDPLSTQDGRMGEQDEKGIDPRINEHADIDSMMPNTVDPDYTASPFEFMAPLLLLVAVAVGTGVFGGSPQVRWAFASGLLLSIFISLFRGMSLPSLMVGIGNGLKDVTVPSVILVLAVVLGGLTEELGGGLYLSSAIGDDLPRIAVPAILFVLTAVIAFATGTSWGTYAIAFPLTMPLAVALATGLDPDAARWFVMLSFAAVLNGSVFGDQCSPISDTTILSAMVADCDLMEHVRTQLVPAIIAGGLAMVGWTLAVVVLC